MLLLDSSFESLKKDLESSVIFLEKKFCNFFSKSKNSSSFFRNQKIIESYSIKKAKLLHQNEQKLQLAKMLIGKRTISLGVARYDKLAEIFKKYKYQIQLFDIFDDFCVFNEGTISKKEEIYSSDIIILEEYKVDSWNSLRKFKTIPKEVKTKLIILSDDKFGNIPEELEKCVKFKPEEFISYMEEMKEYFISY